MGIHAKQNVSHLAHQSTEPRCTHAREDVEMDFDDYIVVVVGPKEHHDEEVARFYTGETRYGRQAWNFARERFLQVFNELKRPVQTDRSSLQLTLNRRLTCSR